MHLSDSVNCETVLHVVILSGVGPVWDDQTYYPEYDGEKEGDGGQEEAAHHTHPGGEGPGLGHLQGRVVHRFHPDVGGELGRAGSLHHLGAGVQGHLQEGDSQREQHPDVNHLDIGGDRQALGDAKEPEEY